MRRAIGRLTLLTMIIGAGLAAPALAQNREKAWEIFPYAGYTDFGSETGVEDEISYGFRFGYHMTRRQMIEFAFDATSTKDIATANFNVDLMTANVNYVLNFFPGRRRERTVLYVSGGAGVIYFSTFGITTNPDLVGDESDFQYNVGGGVRVFGSEKVGVRLDLRRVAWSTEAGEGQDYLQAALGVTLILGGP